MELTTGHHTGRVRVKGKHWIHITHKGPAYDIEGNILGGSGTSPLLYNKLPWTLLS